MGCSRRWADLLAYKGQTVQIRFRGVTNAAYGTVFLLDDTSLAVTVPLRREGGEGAARKAAAAGPEGVLRGEGGGGRVAVAMDGKADSVMEVDALGPAKGEALLPGREEARAPEVNGTSVAWGGRPALGTGPASPGPNAREGNLEEAEGPGDPWGSFESGGRVVSQGSEARKDEVEADPDEGSPADAGPHTLEEWTTSAPAAFSNAVVRYYVTDHLGSPRVVLDAQRQTLDRHDYEPFGVELTPFTDQADLTHRFTGHERDLQTGYDYMHYRFYGSNMGRFLKPDNIPGALTDPQSLNLYAYVRNNPANATDPTGHLSDLFLREIAASPSSDQGIGATRTADGTPPPAGQKEAEDLNERSSSAVSMEKATAFLVTDMTNGRTMFSVSYPDGTTVQYIIETSNDVVSSSKPGSQNGFITYDVQQVKLPADDKRYGIKGAYIDVGNQYDIHGGGSVLTNPFEGNQPLKPTQGCTRGHNEDVKAIADLITAFKAQFNQPVIYVRYGTPPGATHQNATIPESAPFIQAIMEGSLQIFTAP